MSAYPIDIQKVKTRKSISISIKEGRVIVRAPKRISDAYLNALIVKKRSWIEKQLAKSEALVQAAKQYDYRSGCKLHYLGRTMSLSVVKAANTSFECLENTLLVKHQNTSPSVIKALLHDWLKESVEKILAEKSAYFAAKLGVAFEGIAVKRYRRQWGSCSNHGNLTYNWLLIQADMRIIDYVVAHELSHRLHMDHSKAFWACVASICPEYETRRKWLREHGDQLMLI